jgi:hypothetical protein
VAETMINAAFLAAGAQMAEISKSLLLGSSSHLKKSALIGKTCLIQNYSLKEQREVNNFLRDLDIETFEELQVAAGQNLPRNLEVASRPFFEVTVDQPGNLYISVESEDKRRALSILDENGLNTISTGRRPLVNPSLVKLLTPGKYYIDVRTSSPEDIALIDQVNAFFIPAFQNVESSENRFSSYQFLDLQSIITKDNSLSEEIGSELFNTYKFRLDNTTNVRMKLRQADVEQIEDSLHIEIYSDNGSLITTSEGNDSFLRESNNMLSNSREVSKILAPGDYYFKVKIDPDSQARYGISSRTIDTYNSSGRTIDRYLPSVDPNGALELSGLIGQFNENFATSQKVLVAHEL